MDSNQIKKFLDSFGPHESWNLVMILREEQDPKSILDEIKAFGYASYLRQTASGVEIVITDCTSSKLS